MPSRVSDAEQAIRDLVNEPRSLASLIQKPATFSRVCSALDTIGDIDLALDAFAALQNPTDDGTRYLVTYGVLQAVYAQQDATFSLAAAFGVTYVIDPILTEIRNVRAMSVGHPSQTRDKAFHFINRGTLSVRGFELRTRHADGRSTTKHVDLPAIVQRHREGVGCLLDSVLAHLRQKETEHRLVFQDTKVRDALPDILGYYFEKMYDAIGEGSDHGPKDGPYGAIHVELVQKAVKTFQRLVAERGPDGGFDTVTYYVSEIWYPLEQLVNFFTARDAGRLSKADANIFVFFVDIKIQRLQKMAEEIDEEYASPA